MAMGPIVLDWVMFAPGEGNKWAHWDLLRLMETGVRHNQGLLRRYRNIPDLYKAGVKYQIEKGERWKDILAIIRDGWGDCEDLAMWRVAELRERSRIPAKPYAKWRKVDGNFKYHAIVWLPGNILEDPSKKLGMPSKASY